MNIGDRKTFIFDRTFNYLVRIPAPYNRAQILDHLRELHGHVVDNLDVVELEVVGVRSACDELRDDRRDTDRCPPPAIPDLLADDAERLVGMARGGE